MATARQTRRRHGEGSIYQRNRDGKWVGTIDLGVVAGKRKRISATASTHGAVLKKLREMQHVVDHGVIPERATVEQWVTNWLDKIAPGNLRGSTIQGYRSKAQLYIYPSIGNVRLDKLTADHVRALHTYVTEQGLTTTTARGAHAVLESALTQAVQDKRILYNAARDVKAPPARKKPHAALTGEQARAVLAAATDERDLCRLCCALLLGLRQGEALALRWSDVHFIGEAGVVVIREAMWKPKGRVVQRGDVKSEASHRDVPLFPLAAAIFAAWQAKADGDGYLFPSPKLHGVPVGASWDHRSWKDALDRAGVPAAPLHGARGSTATLLQQLAVPDRVIAEILGHSTVRITNQHYFHPDALQRSAALEQLGTQLGLTQIGQANSS